MTWTHGSFYRNELMTRDAEAAKKFYGDSLGWTFDAMPMPDGTYWIAKMGDKPIGGIFTLGPEHAGMADAWMAYIAVDDVDARLKKGQAGGGRVMREPFDVPGVGRIAILLDATGAMIGWMTPVSA
jgi:predicted enzyme related to lactoylglutathione lyase